MSANIRRYIVEFTGTFFLVLTIGCVSYFGGERFLSPLAIGFALMVMVYAGGPISGGHYNPAVSLAAALKKALPFKELIPYMFSQFLGALLGACTVNYLADGPETPAIGFYLPALVIAEFLFTFALCFVVILTSMQEEVRGNSYFGLAIGATVFVGAAAVGGTLCLGAFNPAVALGLSIMNACCFKLCLITIITNLLAGTFAASLCKFLSKKI